MSDGYWRFADSRQQQQQPPPPHPVAPLMGKRPRSDYGVPGGDREVAGYFPHNDDRGARVIRDTDSINASYDRYLRSGQIPSYAGMEVGRHLSGGIPSHPVDDPRIGSDLRITTDPRIMDPVIAMKGRTSGLGSGRPEIPLPHDASNTLFVEGLPPNCTRREVAHIFRPFVGYKEVRLVTKESRHSGGEPLVLCFVDFLTPAHAATAMDALQGYKFDELDHDSAILRLQFARYPGARSGGGHRGKR
ncbi:hypothetical protein Nepgr_010704 [Nepenthes gracilis]|uniref:RRM domain-containing protein n=1 Tax=Nepenthes gracilis TaxID=150966 RepID=A0AAD3XLK8_NEPGR|nr:hypothetical protein Nepgr_010704 [Nepenthes gracilis]